MKTLIATCAVVLAPTVIFGLPNYDPFSNAAGSGGTAYAVGNWLGKSDGGAIGTGQKDATGGLWYQAGGNGSSISNSPIIVAGNLPYGDLVCGSSNKVLVGNALPVPNDLGAGRYFNSTMNKPLTTGGTASRFYSFVMQASDLSGLGGAGGTAAWIAGFNNTGAASQSNVPTVIGGRTILKSVVGGYQIGLCKATDAPQFYTSQTFTTSDKVLVVVEYVVNTGSTSDDVVNMWINPSYTTFGNNGNKPAATLTASTGTDMTTSGSLQCFLLGNKAATGLHFVDNLRVTDNWADATPAGGPAITNQPISLTVDYGQPAVFSVGAESHGTITNQWRTLVGGNWVDLSGETNATLTIASAAQANEGSYKVTVFGPNGTNDSSVVTLTVNDPKITTQPPASQSLPPGGTAVFSTAAIGTPTLTYLWKKDGADVVDGTFGGTVISGAHSNILTISGVRAGGLGDGGNYVLGVTNGNGRGTVSTTATLTIIDPAITSQPQSQAKNYNDTVSFSVTVAGSQPPFSYVWQKNGSPVTVDGIHIVQNDSGTASTLTINNLTFADQATTPGYRVIVSDNLNNSTASSTATLTVADPRIITPVSSVITNAGSTAQLKLQAAGSTVTYTWKTNGVAVANGGTPWGSTISGATSDTLMIAGVTATDAKTYVVEVSGAGPTLSSTGTLSVVQITQQPTPATLVIATNTRAVFVAGASVTGPGSLTYQWRKSSGDIGGATAAALTIASAQTTDSDSYHVRVTYGPGSQFIDSGSAALTVSSAALQLQRTNLVIARIGDGVQALRDAGNSIFLDQFTPSGVYVNTITIPDSGTNAIIARGSAGNTINSLSGMTALTVSGDGRYLVIPGYGTNYDPNATAVLGSNSSADQQIPRAVTTLDKSAQYALQIETLPANIGGSAFRCAAFDGVDEYWGATGSGTIGVYYFGMEAAAGAVTFNNARIVSLVNSVFYVGGANLGIFHFNGKPHPGDTFTQDITFSSTGGSGGCDFAVSPDGNTIYVADGRSWSTNIANTTGGIQRWDKSGGVFPSSPTTILRPESTTTNGALYLTVDFSQPNAVVYATVIGASQNNLVRIVDDGSNSGAGTSTVLAAAGPNQEFRGIRFGPSATPPRPVLSSNLPGAGTASVTVSWSSVAGVTYRLDYKDDLSASVWTPLNTNTASGSTTSYVDTTTPAPAHRFYRVAIP